MSKTGWAWISGLAISVAACGEVPAAEAGDEARDVAVSARPQPASPTVLATAADQEFLGGLLVSGGNVLFGGGHTVALPPEAGPPSEMVGVLRSVPSGGGAVTELWTGNGSVDDIALASGALLSLAYAFFSRTGHLNRLPTAGTVVELASWSSHGSSHSLASNADVAYWTHSAGAGTFVKSTTADGTTATLADSQTL